MFFYEECSNTLGSWDSCTKTCKYWKDKNECDNTWGWVLKGSTTCIVKKMNMLSLKIKNKCRKSCGECCKCLFTFKLVIVIILM